MKHYELTYLTRPDMSEEDAKSLQDKLGASITAKQGVIVEAQKAYKKRLAYPVKKFDAAYVNTVLFDLEPANLETFVKEIREEAQILRSLTLAYTPYVAPVMSRARIHAAQNLANAAAEAAAGAIPAPAPANDGEKAKPEIETRPKRKSEKPKADLTEIGEKLDEILND